MQEIPWKLTRAVVVKYPGESLGTVVCFDREPVVIGRGKILAIRLEIRSRRLFTDKTPYKSTLQYVNFKISNN
jgi:hypothetical protein